MKKIGTIHLGNEVIVSDAIMQMEPDCTVIVDDMAEGAYDCFEEYYNEKIARLIVIKEGTSFENLEFQDFIDMVGFDDNVVGIFDYPYFKFNKETHDKEWRQLLKDATHINKDNPEYKPYTESKMYKTFLRKTEKLKDTLKSRSIGHPEYLELIDELFVCDISVELKPSRMVSLPTKFINSFTNFYDSRPKVHDLYENDACSKQYIVEYIAACYDGKCFIASPEKKPAPFSCFVGYNTDGQATAIILDFNIIGRSEEEDDDEENWEYTENLHEKIRLEEESRALEDDADFEDVGVIESVPTGNVEEEDDEDFNLALDFLHNQVSEEDSHNEEDVIFDEDGEIDDEATLELAQTDFRPDDFDEFDDDDVLKTIF